MMINEKRLGKRFEKRHTTICLGAIFTLLGAGLYAAGITIPSEVNDSLTTIEGAFTGTTAKTIVGICFAGSCIAYAYNKDNEKMKAKIIAIAIACVLLGITQTVVSNLMASNT